MRNGCVLFYFVKNVVFTRLSLIVSVFATFREWFRVMFTPEFTAFPPSEVAVKVHPSDRTIDDTKFSRNLWIKPFFCDSEFIRFLPEMITALRFLSIWFNRNNNSIYSNAKLFSFWSELLRGICQQRRYIAKCVCVNVVYSANADKTETSLPNSTDSSMARDSCEVMFPVKSFYVPIDEESRDFQVIHLFFFPGIAFNRNRIGLNWSQECAYWVQILLYADGNIS